MSEARVRRVVIAGGGTVGWVAAVALSHQFRGLLDIVLVESEQIGTIGVGESTIPPIRTFHSLVQVDEREFMRAVACTFKLGISFEHWTRPGACYFHPFGDTGRGTWACGFHHFWLDSLRRGMRSELAQYSLEAAAARAGRFGMPGPAMSYAYHLDAGMYARFLRGISERQGVHRIEGRIRQVRQHPESGFVQSLVLEDGRQVDGDLFVDCTGFRGLLIEQTLHAGYEDWSRWLPCDRAVTLQTEAVGPPVPYTRAIAHAAGWRWQIPLQHRVGNGLVYASRHLSDDEAAHRLRSGLEGQPRGEPRVVPFRTGRRRRVWDRNVVALGLASGFVEPLESTSIHLAMAGVVRLVELFPFEGMPPSLVEHYNEVARTEMEQVRDFILLHYHANGRDEPMWKECRGMELPPSLALRLQAWRERAHAWQEVNELFRTNSWIHVLLGQDVLPAQHHPLARALPDADLRRLLDAVRQPVERAVAQLPAHQDFLAGYCPAPASAWGVAGAARA